MRRHGGFDEIPGVEDAGFSTSLPWTGYDENTGFDIEGYVPRPGESISARYQAAIPGFFRSLGTRLVSGRYLSDGDDAKSAKVISSTRRWPGAISRMRTRLAMF